MNKTFKKILPSLSILSATLIICFAIIFRDEPPSISELNSLNSKFGLISARPMDSDGMEIAESLFHTNIVLNASILKISGPEKDLIVQIKAPDNADLKNIFLIKFRTDYNVADIAKAYKNLDLVNFAEPDYALSLNSSATVPDAKKNTSSSLSEPSADGKKSVVVALIDSGVDIEHKDLKNKIVQGWDFLDNDNTAQDAFGHGTHLAGIITKKSSAFIMPIRITDGKNGKLSDLIKSIKFAADNHADIINLSLGLPNKSGILKEAIDYATRKNIFVVAAAGNYNSKNEYYPAAYQKVFSVAALDKKGDKLFISDYGKWVDYSVAAQDVYSTLPGNKYGYKTGTSQAAAILTAKIASILAKTPDYDFSGLSDKLLKISKPIKSEDYAGLLGRKL
jgi:subtilisin family serine protease